MPKFWLAIAAILLAGGTLFAANPPLVGFGRAAAPAFRDGKPVECNVTLPIYYEP